MEEAEEVPAHDDPGWLPGRRSEGDLDQDDQVAIGLKTTGALFAQLEMVLPPRPILSRRLHVPDSQTGVCSLIEEQYTGRYVPFWPEGAGS